MLIGGGAASSAVASSIFSKFALYDVRDYGALGNGVANDAAAIQAAVDAAHAAGGGTVYASFGGLGNDTFLIGTQVTKTQIANVTVTGIYGITTYKKDPNLSGRMFDFGASTFPASVTVPDCENVWLENLIVEGKGLVNAGYLGAGGGDVHAATYVSPGVVTVSGDLTAVYTANASVTVVGTPTQTIIVSSSSYSSGTGLTTVTTTGTFTAATSITLTIDATDNLVAFKKAKNCGTRNVTFKNCGNGGLRVTLVGEAVLWNPTSHSVTAADADTLNISSSDSSLYVVNSVIQVLNSGGTEVGRARVTVNGSTFLDVTVLSGTLTGAASIKRSYLDNGPFQGKFDCYNTHWVNVAQPITSNDSGHEGITVHPGCTLTNCGAIKLTSKSWTGKHHINGLVAKGCSLPLWFQSCTESVIENCRIIDATATSTKESITVSYNSEQLVPTALRNNSIINNWFTNATNIYMAGDAILVTQNVNTSGNIFTNSKAGRGNHNIVWASGKLSGFTCRDGVTNGNPSGTGALSVIPTVGAGDTHREQIDISGWRINDVTGVAPLIVNGTATRNLRGFRADRVMIGTESTTSSDIRYIEDGGFSNLVSKTAFSNFLATRFDWNNCNIQSTLAASCIYLGGGSVISINGGYLSSTNAGTSAISGLSTTSSVNIKNVIVVGNTRGINFSQALNNVSIMGCDVSCTGAGIAISFTGAAVRLIVTGNNVNGGPSGTSISINASPTKYVASRNQYIGTLSLDVTGQLEAANNVNVA